MATNLSVPTYLCIITSVKQAFIYDLYDYELLLILLEIYLAQFAMDCIKQHYSSVNKNIDNILSQVKSLHQDERLRHTPSQNLS